ncbi:uncharacterized protein LOC133784822 [Humulus lupulus]|uniref:uncharacterized protein LOC133784822 n=1 Tax=Humulus lupulus TaxID=3486 RepID=UPI002B40206E|nr:uncharacterized protein LOC133784822 [Humulus lupulus]
MEQEVEYEWLPIKCKACSGFVHAEMECRKDLKAKWVKKETTSKEEVKSRPTAEEEMPTGLEIAGLVNVEKEGDRANTTEMERAPVATSEGNQLKTRANSDIDKDKQNRKRWLTPKRVASHLKSGQLAVSTTKSSEQGQDKLNQFQVLQEHLCGNKDVVDICSRFKIGIGGFLETKMKGSKILDFMKQKLPNWDFYTSLVIEGRLLIVWKNVFVKVTILEDSPQFVHCLVSMVGQKQRFYITFVYGFNSLEGRRRLWEGLLRLSLVHEAWIILGDFNAPFSGMDRADGNPISGVEMADSVRWLEEAHVAPLKSLGSFFSWTNNQNGPTRIYSKIDHVFINEAWIDLFPYATAVFRWEVVSDHYSCVVNIQSKVSLGTKLFRFYNFWADHPKFSEVVRFSWHLPIHATGLRAIFLKTLRLKHSLKKFNHNTFGDIGLSFDLAKEKYQDAQLKAQANPTEFIALFGIPSTKSPGLDGYGSGFFKAAWQVVGNEVCYAISHCFETESFPSDLHETSLSLVPKVANPSRAINYRPIACCTTLYKCIAKLLCSRLALVLPAIVQPNQGAFIMGRSIAHNIMIFQDLIKNYGRAITSPRCAIKIDLSKAYDMVDWQFLEDLLKVLCFPMKFIGWIMVCLRNTSYSLLMNGRVQGKFKGKKGLRKGDPMSPLLFVLIMEYMTRRLQLVALEPSFRFHPMCKSLKLINLCFADDLILFCKGTHSAVLSLKNALDDFSSATGLTINSAKSQIFFGGVSSAVRNIITQEMNLMESSFPLKSNAAHPLGFIWSPKLLDEHLYFTSECCQGNRELCRSFLWGSAGLRSKPHLASWQKVCLPKAYGGLGFRDGALWNREILANWYWRKLCHIREKFSFTEIQAAGSFGRFQLSKLYNFALNQQLVGYYSAVWCKLTLPTHRFLLWQVVNEQLLTRDNLLKLHIQVLQILFNWFGFIAWPSDFTSWSVWLARPRHGLMAAILNLSVAATAYNMDSENVFDIYSAPEAPAVPSSRKKTGKRHPGESSKAPQAKKPRIAGIPEDEPSANATPPPSPHEQQIPPAPAGLTPSPPTPAD